MINDLSVDKKIILAATVLILSGMAVLNLATLPRTALQRFLHQKHHAIKADLIQGIYTSTTGSTDHIPIMVLEIGDISACHSPILVATVTVAAVLEGASPTLLRATAAVHTTLQLMDAPITPHTVIPTGIVTPHTTLTTFPTGATHATPQTWASLAPATSATQQKGLSPGKESSTQDPQPAINPTTPKLSPSRIPLQTLHQIMIVPLIL